MWLKSITISCMASCLRIPVFCKYYTSCIVCFACNPIKPTVKKMHFKEMFHQKKPLYLYRVKFIQLILSLS